MRPSLLPLSMLVLALALAGCDDRSRTTKGNGGGALPPAPPATVTVTPSLGLITEGAVTWQQLGGSWQASASTGTGGTATFTIPVDVVGPYLITVCGSDSGNYFDEALSALSAFGPGQCLRAVVPDLDRPGVGVTALTEAAVRYMETGGSLATATPAEVEAALEFVRGKLMPEVGDLLQPPTLVGSASDLLLLTNDDAGRYALKLAVLAKSASALAATRGGSTAPAWEVADMLGLDLADGSFDGQDDGSFIVSPVYDIFHLGTLLQAQLTALGGSSDNLAALVAGLEDALPLALPDLPAGSDALISWQGSYNGTWSTTSTASFGSISGSATLSAFQGQLVPGNACSITIDNGQLQVSGLPFIFSFDRAAVSDSYGIRSYTFERRDNVMASMGLFSLPMVVTSTGVLRMQGSEVLGMSLSATGEATGLTLNIANAHCQVPDPV